MNITTYRKKTNNRLYSLLVPYLLWNISFFLLMYFINTIKLLVNGKGLHEVMLLFNSLKLNLTQSPAFKNGINLVLTTILSSLCWSGCIEFVASNNTA